MVSFIHNESDITTWMGYSFKTKSTKPRAKLDSWTVRQRTKTAIFIAIHMEKHI